MRWTAQGGAVPFAQVTRRRSAADECWRSGRGLNVPRIFDNIDQQLLPALRETCDLSDRADFCVGYFNLRGWKQLHDSVEQWSGGEGHCCRLLVGMQKLPHDQLRAALRLAKSETGIDNKTAIELKRRLAAEFREQLALGLPTNEDEAGLRRLAAQIRAQKVVIKLFLRYPLHAKLYLLFRPDPISPIVGYLGSSNLTLAGLSQQGELNVDVLDHDACQKLAKWFEDRWTNRLCMDISAELVQVIEESWAREEALPPYYIYLKMAYHLSQEARAGLSEFRIPRDFRGKLLEFQTAAVRIAAHHVNKRDGVLLGDVVGLGKTLMATALARIFEDDHGWSTLILCPKNLVKMWQDHVYRYGLRARVVSLSQVNRVLPEVPGRFRLVVIDESHNLRNREGTRYRAIREFLAQTDAKCVLLSATPYNKTYLDLSNQLRLFVPEEKDLGIRPESLLRELGPVEFSRKHQCQPNTLAGFEKSLHPDDWRELMRLYLVRRTRSFIKQNYALADCPACGRAVQAVETKCSSCGRAKTESDRRYLVFEDGSRSPFPDRVPRSAKFPLDDSDPNDQYARLYSDDIVDAINGLELPRYGLGNYVDESPTPPPTKEEEETLADLSRAGKRLMGFCRTNLFKRLESSGHAFLLSVRRHLLRNYVFLHAIDSDLPLPLGTQDAGLLDARVNDGDEQQGAQGGLFTDDEEDESANPSAEPQRLESAKDFEREAATIYERYTTQAQRRFKWLRPSLFKKDLARDLRRDSETLLKVLAKAGEWDASQDAKLEALTDLLLRKHAGEKVLLFSQFADTIDYLHAELGKRGIDRLGAATGNTDDPTQLAWRFSPKSNEKKDKIGPEQELRVLVSTDVLSEGQNLQDAYIVVNYDLPWAIIRLIQRAGRVDRIGQQADRILCYSFLPAEGVERIIRLRARVRERLQENREVVGTDEAFFDDDGDDRTVVDLYNEKSGILDGDDDSEVDLASYAYQIWQNAVAEDPRLKRIIPELQPVVYSTRPYEPAEQRPEGVLLYLRTAEGTDALAWMNMAGQAVTQSQFEILRAAECVPDTPALPRHDSHHELVGKGVEHLFKEEKRVGGQLGRPSGARYRTYVRLKDYAEAMKGSLFDTQELFKTLEDLYNYPLRQAAVDTLNRQLRSGISDEALAELVIGLRDEDRLCLIHEEEAERDPQIICSLGLRREG